MRRHTSPCFYFKDHTFETKHHDFNAKFAISAMIVGHVPILDLYVKIFLIFKIFLMEMFNMYIWHCRNGHFLLPSRNLILSSAITECEEALNQGSLALTEVFISLRNKSILHLFASIGRFLGLKVIYKWAYMNMYKGHITVIRNC
jgi:hypothetical protein